MQIVYNLYTKELYNLLSITNNKFRIFKKSTIIIQLNMIKTDKMKCIEKNMFFKKYKAIKISLTTTGKKINNIIKFNPKWVKQ